MEERTMKKWIARAILMSAVDNYGRLYRENDFSDVKAAREFEKIINSRLSCFNIIVGCANGEIAVTVFSKTANGECGQEIGEISFYPCEYQNLDD